MLDGFETELQTRRMEFNRRESDESDGVKCSPQRTSITGRMALSRSREPLTEAEGGTHRASRRRDACSSGFVSNAEKSATPQVLRGMRTSWLPARLAGPSWHWSFAALAEQPFTAQSGAQTGATNKARTTTSARAPPCKRLPGIGRGSLMARSSNYAGAFEPSTLTFDDVVRLN